MKIPTVIALIALAFSAQAQTSDNKPRLKDALKRFPEADTNKDGVLTIDETKAFKNKAAAPGNENEGEEAGASKHIYKKAGGQSLSLYVWTPEGHKAEAKAPAIVFFHGGGFKNGSYSQFRQQARYLASRGMVAMSVNYRLTTQEGIEVEDCVEDAISAMRWARANADKLGVDPDRIAAGGGSAGGYLAAATLLVDFVNAETDPPGVSAKPNTLVLFNPGFGNDKKRDGSESRDPEGKGDLSKYVKANLPPMINFFGTEDPMLPGAVRFIEACKKTGNRCELLTHEGEGHSFFNKDKYLKLTLAAADKFLTGLGWLEKKEEVDAAKARPE